MSLATYSVWKACCTIPGQVQPADDSLMARPSAEIRANVIVTHPVNEEMRAAYLRHLSGAANVTFFADLPDLDKASLLQVADVVSCSVLVKELSAEQLGALGRVRFIQALTSGIEWMPFDKLPRATVVANNAGVSSPAIAEHGWALAFACAKHLLPNHHKLGRCVWEQQKPTRLLRHRICGILGSMLCAWAIFSASSKCSALPAWPCVNTGGCSTSQISSEHSRI